MLAFGLLIYYIGMMGTVGIRYFTWCSDLETCLYITLIGFMN